MKTSEKMVETLIELGVTQAFTLPGLGITWSLPAFYDQRDKINLVLARSEQVASIMAQVTGRLTGKPGVLLAQGPWAATTGSFGILEAYFSGSPMLTITDTSCYGGLGQYGVYQTMTGDYGGADIKNTLDTITKYCTYATTPEEVIFGTQMAYKHASLPRQGPTAVIMKTSVIRSEFPENSSNKIYKSEGYLRNIPAVPDPTAIQDIAKLMSQADRPVIVAGNGVVTTRSGPALQEFAEKYGIGVVTSYNAKGCIDEKSLICGGMLGTWGNVTANRLLKAADLVVILGASMGPDYTRMRDSDMIRPNDQTLVQVDIDPRNAGWVYPVDLAVTADVGHVIEALSKMDMAAPNKEKRLDHIAALKKETFYDEPKSYTASPGTVHLSEIVDSIQSFIGAKDVITLDAGTNRIWHTNRLRIRHPGSLVVPGGIGGMGWGGPAAAAAKLVFPGKRVTAICGDGGFIMTMDVLATCSQHKIPVTFVVCNNSGLGMVRDNMGEKRLCVDFGTVNYADVAKGLGAWSQRVETANDLLDALVAAHQYGEGPSLIEVITDPMASHVQVSDY
ncbi:MAG: thiamine pyrophosphate-binding protein [Desulfobulbaceae bacterium]|nr:thiamine pyrophosphate-binding protein [Desulfobulbaceae bacterium]